MMKHEVLNDIAERKRILAMIERCKDGELMIDDTIKRSDAIDAIERTTWYHINRQGKLVSGANSFDDEPLYKAEDVYKAIEGVPPVDRPQGEAPLEHGYMWTCPKCGLDAHSDFESCPRCGYEREDRPQGEWTKNVFRSDIYRYECSNCKAHHRARYDFCPSCGARMKGADDE